MTSDPSAGAPYRGGVSPVFSGRRGAPLIVTTRNPFAIRTELRFAAAFAWTLVASGALAAFSWALSALAGFRRARALQRTLRVSLAAHADAVAARALRLVHRRVRRRDERLRVLDLALDRGADADGDRDDLALVLEALLLDRGAQPLAQRCAPRRPRSRGR